MASALIVLLTLAAFVRVVTCDFTSLDDPGTISFNPGLNPPTFQSLLEFWNPSRPQMDLYVPVTYTVWSLVAAFAYLPQPDPYGVHLNPWLFHGANLLLHVLSALMVFHILRLGVRPVPAAAAGALLFALHPVQVEAVAWASGTKDVLYGLLSLVALWGYLTAARPPAPRRLDGATPTTSAGIPSAATTSCRSGWYWAATAALVLAMLSKPTAVVTPVIAAALDLLLLRRRLRDVAGSVLPWLALAVPVLIEGRFAQPAIPHGGYVVPMALRPLIATDALAFYLYKLAWPASLGFPYNRSPAVVVSHGWLYWTWIVPAAFAAAALVPLALRGRRGGRERSGRDPGWPAAALAVFWIGVLPVLGLVPFDFQQFSTAADHYLYLAMLGPALAVAYALAASARAGRMSARWAGAACVLGLAALGTRTFLQTRYWQDSFTMYEHFIRVNPYSPDLYDNLAKAYADAGRPGDALRWDEEAVRRWPGRAASHVNLATDLAALGRLAEAQTQYQAALRIDPGFKAAAYGIELLRQHREPNGELKGGDPGVRTGPS